MSKEDKLGYVQKLEAEVERLARERDEALLIHQTDTGTESAVAALQEQLAAAQKEDFSRKCKLVKIHDALSSMGDSDPILDDDMTDEEVLEYEPIFWAAKEIAVLIGEAPWDKYATDMQGKEGE